MVLFDYCLKLAGGGLVSGGCQGMWWDWVGPWEVSFIEGGWACGGGGGGSR